MILVLNHFGEAGRMSMPELDRGYLENFVTLFEFEASAARASTFSMITPNSSATRGDALKSRDSISGIIRHLLIPVLPMIAFFKTR